MRDKSCSNDQVQRSIELRVLMTNIILFFFKLIYRIITNRARNEAKIRRGASLRFASFQTKRDEARQDFEVIYQGEARRGRR